MEFKNMQQFYQLQYIQPTIEHVSKYSKIEEILGKRRSASTGSKRSLPQFQTQFEIRNEEPLYSSSSQSHFILKKNAWTFNQINQALKNEKDKQNKIVQSKKLENQRLVTSMPKIKHTINLKYNKQLDNSPLEDSLTKRAENNNLIIPTFTTKRKTLNLYKAFEPKKMKDLKFRWMMCKINPTSPESREGASISSVGKKIYLYGGLSRALFNDVSVMAMVGPNLVDESSYIWEHYDMAENPYNISLQGRYGHSSSVYKNNLYIFGGCRMYNKYSKSRECLNDLIIYHPDVNMWEPIKCTSFLEQRRNHVSCVFGKHLIVHGGINGCGEYLDDIHVLNLQHNLGSNIPLKWVKINPKGYKPEKIAYHSCCAVLSYQKYRNINEIIYNYQNSQNSQNVKNCDKIAHEGVYLFGGRDDKGYLYNKLQILKFHMGVPEWVMPDIEGVAPLARYGHSMNYIESMKIIIIFGGRNDKNFQLKGTVNLNDISILNVADQLSWQTYHLSGKQPIPRYSHCASVIDDYLIIFGGLSDNNYCSSELCVLLLDQHKVKTIKEDEENMNHLRGSSNNFIKEVTQEIKPRKKEQKQLPKIPIMISNIEKDPF